MRTDKVIGKIVTKEEWADLVSAHYSQEEQKKRIDEVVDFVVQHCLSVKENKLTTFKGLWGYLDCDTEHTEIFISELADRLQLSGIGEIIEIKTSLSSEDSMEEDLIITWSM